MLLKKISSIFFLIAMLLAILLFFDFSQPYITANMSMYFIVILGVVASLINLFNVRTTKQSYVYNTVYWLSSVLMILGIAQFLLWPSNPYLLIVGMLLMGISFFIPKNDKKQKDEDLLDDF